MYNALNEILEAAEGFERLEAPAYLLTLDAELKAAANAGRNAVFSFSDGIEHTDAASIIVAASHLRALTGFLENADAEAQKVAACRGQA